MRTAQLWGHQACLLRHSAPPQPAGETGLPHVAEVDWGELGQVALCQQPTP